MFGKCRAHHLFLDSAELLLAVIAEDVGDGAASRLDDLGVVIEQRHSHRLGEPTPNGGLTGSRHAHQYGPGSHQPDACAGSRSASCGCAPRVRTERRYVSMLARVSASESPPNFSSVARASTSATMVSTTTPAAGTAHTSERWWIAAAPG